MSFGFTERSLWTTSNTVFKNETEPIYPARDNLSSIKEHIIKRDSINGTINIRKLST